MLNADWTIRTLERAGWKLLKSPRVEEQFIHLWWAKNHSQLPAGDTWITLSLERSISNPSKLINQHKLHTRSKFASWVHLESYVFVGNAESINNLAGEVERLEKLQSFEI